MEVCFYLICMALIVSVFGFITSKIEDEVIRVVCLAIGGTLLFFGGLAGLFTI